MNSGGPPALPRPRHGGQNSRGGGGSNAACHKSRQQRMRRNRRMAGDAGGELAEGVHCGGDLSQKECARIIRRTRRNRKFWKLPAPPQGGERLFRPICDVRIRLVRRKAVMSARAGRRRLFRRIPPNPPPPTSKLRKQTEKGGKFPPESGDFQGRSALKRVERGLPLPGNFQPVEARFSRLTSLSSRIPRNGL